MTPTRTAVAALAKFVEARERHRVAKEAGGNPARADPIISKYRFCNVRRNDDRVTKWIHRHILTPWRDQPHLWFALVVARLFNNEPTLDELLAPANCVLPFKPEAMRKILHARKAAGQKNFNAAYIVSTNGLAMDKVDYVIDRVLTPLWEARRKITRDMDVGQLANCHLLLTEYQGLGSFMAAQVLADLKYASPDKWEDFHTFAASGPGSRRGLNRVLGRPVDAPWREADFRNVLGDLRTMLNARLGMEPLTAQDVQNCLCEYDKYERVRTGQGEPKQLYKPKEG